METVVVEGTWLYSGIVPTQVRVVRLDYDFWFAIGQADDDLAPGETPGLNVEGHLYYVRHKPGWSEGQPFWPDSPGYLTVPEAKAAAEAMLHVAVEWRL